MIFEKSDQKAFRASLRPPIKPLAVLLCVGLLAINLAFLIENPEHLFQPDPDCSICQITSLQLIFDAPEPNVPELVLIEKLQDNCFQPHISSYHFSFVTPRAPPFSF